VHAGSSESVVKVNRKAAELSSGATRYSLRLFRGSQCYAVPQSLMLKSQTWLSTFISNTEFPGQAIAGLLSSEKDLSLSLMGSQTTCSPRAPKFTLQTF